MRIIRTYQDVVSLRSFNHCSPLTNYISEYFQQLHKMLSREDEAEFSLQDHGYIILLEPGDNLHSSRTLGLDVESGGLLDIHSEYVEAISIEGITIYKIAHMCDNDYLMTYFTIAGSHDEAIEEWLHQQAGLPLTPEKLILRSLKETFERNEIDSGHESFQENAWIMATSALLVTSETPPDLFPDYADVSHFKFVSSPSTVTYPIYVVRTVLRLNDSVFGLDEYVDGNTFCFEVDGTLETATLLWEDDAFNDSPAYHGGPIDDALRWVAELAKPFHIQLGDPFLPL